MVTLLTGISQLATPPSTGPRRGAAMRDLLLLSNAAVAVRGDRIAWVGPRVEWSGHADAEVDLGGRAVIPALVDPHTHAIWGGDRYDDFAARAAGVAYEEILARGGGIRSTVRHTAGATAGALAGLAAPRIDALVRSGAATIEVKSGYGLDPDAEVRSLEAIAVLRPRTSARLVATLLIHLPPAEASRREAYLDRVTGELLPAVTKRGLATACDVFVEREAWTVEEGSRILGAAVAAGLQAKAHVDQFHALGGVAMAIRHGARSVDHLEASRDAEIRALANSNTVATLLPGVTLHLGIPAAPGRALVDAGAIVAVGTDLNPGSSPLFSTQQALALSVRLNGLAPVEALNAATVNAAAALGLDDCGAVVEGARADLAVLDATDWREAAWRLGAAPVAATWIGGREVTR
jgi:imidazolonepropionase